MTNDDKPKAKPEDRPLLALESEARSLQRLIDQHQSELARLAREAEIETAGLLFQRDCLAHVHHAIMLLKNMRRQLAS